VKNPELNALLDQAVSLSAVQHGLLSDLTKLNDEFWQESFLGETMGANELTGKYHYIRGTHEDEVRNLLSQSPTEDLHEIATMSTQEGEARRAMALLTQSGQRISQALTQQIDVLRRWQAVRDLAPEELERRSRQRLVADGGAEALDQFTSRWIFGPWPPAPFVLKANGAAKKRDWLLARVKSGKQVAVENMTFSFSPIYDEWLVPMLKENGLIENDSHFSYNNSAPRYAKPPLAQFYYKMGFKPSKTVQGAYQIAAGWNENHPWHLHHTRTFNVKDLMPVE
jgi:hypothetical protein